MKILHAIDRYIEIVEKTLIVFLFVFFILLITSSIFSRNLFQVSSQLVSEKTPLFVLWLALLGASLGIKDNKHIKLELLLRFVSGSFKDLALLVGHVFAALVLLVLFYLSITFVQGEIKLFGAWGWSIVIMPVFFFVASFRFFLKSLENLNSYKRRG